MKILFVCEGNMMRSQMAEAFYNQMTNAKDGMSAGVTAESKEHISPRAVEIMQEINMDLRDLKPKQLDEAMIEAVDKIVYFPSDFMPDYVKNNQNAELWDVIDPHYHREEGMDLVRNVRDDIRTRVKKLVQEKPRG